MAASAHDPGGADAARPATPQFKDVKDGRRTLRAVEKLRSRLRRPAASKASAELSHRLLRVARDLALTRDLGSVMAIVRTAARELTGADGVTFVLREGAHCHYADEDAIAPLWSGRRFPLETCISGWVMLRGVPVVIPDIYADARIPHAAYRPTFVKSLVMVPVKTPDPVAAIGAYWARPHHATREELTTLETLAESAALALANVQLYDDLRLSLSRERLARRQAEAATGAKDDFLQMIAHELRQPLAACAAAVAVMNARPESPASSRGRDVVQRQVDHMTRLVDDLLDAARVVRGQAVLRRRLIDLRELLRDAIDGVESLVAERQHQLEVSLPDDSVWVVADPDRLRQVFVNLLTNAAKYTNPGGRISVSLQRREGRAAIHVKDTGHGLEQQQLARIFDLFTRAATAEGGFGIGLAVARSLVDQHGGTLEAQSEGLGQGSEFIVRLPVANPAAATESA